MMKRHLVLNEAIDVSDTKWQNSNPRIIEWWVRATSSWLTRYCVLPYQVQRYQFSSKRLQIIQRILRLALHWHGALVNLEKSRIRYPGLLFGWVVTLLCRTMQIPISRGSLGYLILRCSIGQLPSDIIQISFGKGANATFSIWYWHVRILESCGQLENTRVHYISLGLCFWLDPIRLFQFYQKDGCIYMKTSWLWPPTSIKRMHQYVICGKDRYSCSVQHQSLSRPGLNQLTISSSPPLPRPNENPSHS